MDGFMYDPLHTKTQNQLCVKVVHGMDDLMKVIVVRAAVFLGEEDCAYALEFDGNDQSATHLLATIGDEPVGAFRIRWFPDYARLERLAIRKRYRQPSVLNALVEHALDLCQQKGYERITGLARDRILKFWMRRGGVPCGEPILCSDETLVPIVVPTTRGGVRSSPFSIDNIGTQQLEDLLALPEGNWPKEVLAHAA